MKPQMNFNVRVSTDSSQKQRYTEQEIKSFLKEGKVELSYSNPNGSCLMIRKGDGAVLGEILTD